MAAGTYDFIGAAQVEQGATFAATITWRDAGGSLVDLSGYTAKMEVRPTASSSTIIIALTTVNGRITLGGALGTIALLISATDTTALAGPLSAVYDLKMTSPGGVVTRLIQGKFAVDQEVTQ